MNNRCRWGDAYHRPGDGFKEEATHIGFTFMRFCLMKRGMLCRMRGKDFTLLITDGTRMPRQ